MGGGMPAAASRSARLRAALEGSKDRRMGRQACRTIAGRALQPLAQISGPVRPLKREGLGSGVALRRRAGSARC